PTGAALAAGDTVPRLALVVAFIFVSQLVTAGLAFWLSTKTDAPLGAVGGAVGLTIVGNVLDAVTALGSWRDFLPAHWQFAWADALQPELEWGGMIKGAAISVTYALILFALAFRGFSRKDIVS
ncbi:ABC transporter permease, partial [Streptomyces sp. SID8455]|nr:ABC transporter permease [Streptomyces sp. SID8455]